MQSSFINSWGMKNSGISKSWCAPISLKLPCNCYRARKQFIRQSNTVFSLVRLAMWLLRTNQSTVLHWRRKCFRAVGNTVFLLVRLIMWLLKTNKSTIFLWGTVWCNKIGTVQKQTLFMGLQLRNQTFRQVLNKS